MNVSAKTPSTPPPSEGHHLATISHEGRFWDVYLEFEDDPRRPETFRALLCSMVVHGWGNGMHPYHNPGTNQDGHAVEVRVSKDILMSMEDLQSLRYVKKDDQGRVKQALFEPDHNVRIRQQIDADSLAYVTMDGLYRAMGEAGRNNEVPQFCDACFSGDYPIALTDFDEGGATTQPPSPRKSIPGVNPARLRTTPAGCEK